MVRARVFTLVPKSFYMKFSNKIAEKDHKAFKL
jgi:hypothetical protein